MELREKCREDENILERNRSGVVKENVIASVAKQSRRDRHGYFVASR